MQKEANTDQQSDKIRKITANDKVIVPKGRIITRAKSKQNRQKEQQKILLKQGKKAKRTATKIYSKVIHKSIKCNLGNS